MSVMYIIKRAREVSDNHSPKLGLFIDVGFFYSEPNNAEFPVKPTFFEINLSLAGIAKIFFLLSKLVQQRHAPECTYQ